MAKILLMILAFIILVFVVVAMYCTMVLAGRFDDNDNNGDNNKGYDNEMFLKKRICSRCKTGKYTYELDPKSETCPYIGCWKKNRCYFYKPLDKPSKNGILSGFKKMRNTTNQKMYEFTEKGDIDTIYAKELSRLGRH